MSDFASLHVVVHGHVQGVFFRAFIAEKANELGITGYACNLPSGEDVDVLAEGEKGNLEKLIERVKIGPPAARVEKVVTTWSKYTGKYSQFKIKY